jgi:hypothetical protein
VNKRRTGTLVVWVLVAVAVLVVRGRRPGPLTVEERTTLPNTVGDAPEQLPAISTPATRAEIDAALVRAFAGTVETQTQGAETAVADFNGDGAPDLAAVVHRAEARAFEVNDALRNWSVQDVMEHPGPGRARPGDIEEGEHLLAIVHGHGPAGWKNPEARQAYLLKNAAGAKLTVARSPTLRGDLLSAEVDGVERVIYWTGARYACRR